MQPDLDLLNRRYFLLLKQAGITDRRTFQRDLFTRGVVKSESCREWDGADYAVAVHCVEEAIANA